MGSLVLKNLSDYVEHPKKRPWLDRSIERHVIWWTNKLLHLEFIYTTYYHESVLMRGTRKTSVRLRLTEVQPALNDC